MQARQVEVFCMVMRCGTVTEAATRLNISQPALSQFLMHTEDQLGFKLFNRLRGKLVPTREAEELYPEAERVFAELAAIRRRSVDLRSGRTGLIRVAASAPPAMAIVPRALLAFRKAHPEVVVRSLIAPRVNVVEMVRTGDAPLGVVMNNLPLHGIEVETLGQAELVCLLREDHPLVAREAIGFCDIRDETLISYGANTFPGRLLAGAAEAEGLDFSPQIEIEISITALPFVRDRVGIAIVDGLLPWEQFHGLVRRPLLPKMSVPIAILTSRERPLTGNHAAMRDCLRQACVSLLREAAAASG